MPPKKPFRPRRFARGFSLVLSLVVMAMLLLLCISAAALLSVQLRVSKASVSYAKARLNALAGSRIALGELQRLAGPDRRITAPATILATNPTAGGTRSEGVALPRLTGVWLGRTVSSNYAVTHNDAFRGWLVSGTSPLTGAALLNYPKDASLNSGNASRLLAATTPAPGSDPALDDKDPVEVFAAPENLTDSANRVVGNFSWWVSDENQKANVSMRVPEGTSVLAAIKSATNAPRFGLRLDTDGSFKKFPETVPFSPAVLTRDSLAFDSETAGSVSNPWLGNPRDYYHAITPYSESLLTDVVNGGLKYDLSLMFAMEKLPEGYAGDTGYVGVESSSGGADSYVLAKGGWRASGPATAAITPASMLANNKQEWTCWGDLWNFARLYRHPGFNATTGMLMNSAAEAKGSSVNPLDPQKNVSDVQNLSPWREPVITQVQVVVGIKTQPDPADATNTKDNIYIVQRPYIQLWNPYNVPLRFTGSSADSILGRVICLPGKLTISTGSATYSLNEWASLSSLSSGFNVFQLYLDYQNQAPLAPGEVRVFSPQQSTLVIGGQSSAVKLAAGLRPYGGFGTILRTSQSSYGAPVVQCNKTDIITVSIQTPTAGWYATDPDTYVFNQWARVAYASLTQTTASAAGRGWYTAWSGSAGGRQLLTFDTTALSSPAGALENGNPRFFGMLSMRLRAETAATLKMPYLSYGDPLRWIYNPVATGDYKTNQDVWLSPYEFTQTRISSDTDSGPPDNPVMQCDTSNRGYAFTGYSPQFGATNMVFSHIPLGPLGSLADLRDARLGGGVAYTRAAGAAPLGSIPPGYSVVPNAFGNSYMHPMVAPAALLGNSPKFTSENFYDYSWIMNSALWDSYFMSGLSPKDSPVAGINAENAPLDTVARDFFLGSKDLPNSRLLLRDYGVGAQAMMDSVVSGSAPTAEGFAKSAATMSVNGGFNINSTSVRAWRSLLAGLNHSGVATLANDTKIGVSATALTNVNPVLRNPVQNGKLATVNTGDYSMPFNQQRTMAGRELSDAQLTALAQQIVLQVKQRGPFLSLGEFMNRRLDTTAEGRIGALQAAIDASGINGFATSASVNQVDAAAVASLFPANSAAVTGASGYASLARGMPGYISQADLIGPIASSITPRSDTFTIRVSGSSEEGATAYVELVVSRRAFFVDESDAPFVLPSKLTKPANKAFGRRFVPVTTRWLSENEI